MIARLGLSLALLAATAWADEPNRPPVQALVPAEAAATVVSADRPVAPRAVHEALAGTSLSDGECRPPVRLWVEGGVLCWWVQDGPLAVPLVTTGDPAAAALAGAVGHSSTRVLFGGGDLDYGRSTGYRLTVGGWAGDAPVGAEVSALWLDAESVAFFARSNGSGNPPLYIPVFNLATGGEGSVIVADPVAGFAGDVGVHGRSRLWGWEANGLAAVTRGAVEFTLLAGFRYLELAESLSVQNNSTDLVQGTQTGMLDQFEATNRFYGGQLGGRVTASAGRWFAGLTYRVAAGATRQVVDVAGVTRQAAAPPVPSGTFPGAVFTQPTNLGRRTECEFAAVPELNLRAGCQVAGCVRAFVGYDVLYWSRVVRPGEQIDRVLNPSQSPVFGTGSLTGPARPAALLNATDFVAQGFSAGLELRY
jgi:hypothetical protein